MICCRLEPRCPNLRSDCSSDVCDFYDRVTLDKCVEDTIKELGLTQIDINEICERMHRHRNYEGTGNFLRDYAAFFRQESMFYIEED